MIARGGLKPPSGMPDTRVSGTSLWISTPCEQCGAPRREYPAYTEECPNCGSAELVHGETMKTKRIPQFFLKRYRKAFNELLDDRPEIVKKFKDLTAETDMAVFARENCHSDLFLGVKILLAWNYWEWMSHSHVAPEHIL